MVALQVAVVCALLAALVSGDAVGKLEGRLGTGVFFDGDASKLDEDTRVVLNHGEYVAYVRDDGSFAFNEVPTGSYLLEVYSHQLVFEKVRVDFSANDKAKVRASLATFPPMDSPISVTYPLRLEGKAPVEYFAKREGMDLWGILTNRMFIMMFVMMAMAYAMPKLMANMDPEALKEVQQNSLLSGSGAGTDVSERLVSMFNAGGASGASAGGVAKKEGGKGKASKT